MEWINIVSMYICRRRIIRQKFPRRFGHHLHFRSRKIRNKGETEGMFILLFGLQTAVEYVSPKRRWNPEVHRFTNHKIVIFIVAALRTS
jgi:hypothetical protein